jgi:hypothetical protein
MKNRTVIFISIFVILAAVLILLFWRAQMMGPGARTSPGGLVAVSAEGTPLPAPLAQAGGAPLPENTARQEYGGLTVSLSLTPYPPSLSNANNFEVRLTDSQGQAVSDASIQLDLTMPGMMMPPNQISLEPAGAGLYRASGSFTMRGPWRIEVIITSGGVTRSVYFDVWL